jgi:general stress protein 26
MTDIKSFKADPRSAILKAAADAPAVMLGNPAQGRTFQPMDAHIDDDDGVLRFFAAKDSDLFEGLRDGRAGVTCLVTSRDFDLFASIEGELVERTEAELIDQHFGPMTQAWFEQGRHDPKLALLEFRPQEAAAWASQDDGERFAWEVSAARTAERTPDVGARLTTRFRPN